MKTKEQFKIRLAKTKSDLQGILNVQIESWVSTYVNEERGITESMIRELFRQKFTEKYVKDRFKSLKDETKRTLVVTVTNGSIIGWMWCAKKGEHEGTLAIYILSSYQSLGIGKVLMSRGLKWLSTQKYIEIGVVEYNRRAMKFYEKLGFTPTGKKEDFIVGDFIGKGWVVLMRKEL